MERGVALEFFLDDGVNCVELPADGHFAWDVRWQGLKPNLLQFVYGPTKVVP